MPARLMKPIERPGRWLIILPPLLFLLMFFLIPFAFAFKISFADTAARVPPFTDVLIDHPRSSPAAQPESRRTTSYLFTDEVYGVAYLYSLRTAFFSTLICLALGYPMAYAIARSSKSTQNVLLLIIMLPFWTSFLLRVYALEGIIRDNGLLNTRAAAPRADPRADAASCARASRSTSASSTPTCRSWCCRCSPHWRNSTATLLEAACGPRQPAVARVPRCHAAAVDAGRDRRLDAGVHPGGRRVRHSLAARRARTT